MSISGLLLTRIASRHWRQAPGSTLLLVVILALGVAVFFAIRLANRAALASFRHFTELVTVESDWIIQAPAGDLHEDILMEIRGALGAIPVDILPVVESTATEPPTGDSQRIGARDTFRILGLDLIGLQNQAVHALAGETDAGKENSSTPSSDPARGSKGSPGWFAGGLEGEAEGESSEMDFWRVWRDPRSVFVGASLADRRGLRRGSTFELVINEAVVPLRIAGVIPESLGRPAIPDTLLVMDLPALQRLTGREGRLSRVEFVVEPGGNERERREAVRAILEELAPRRTETPAANAETTGIRTSDRRWHLSTPSDRREAGAMMTRAFRLNLTILSLLALLVGLYLIVQALEGAVVRRRSEIAVLRSLGVEEASIRTAWLLEAAALGIVGGGVGVLLGWLGAQVSVKGVGQTVNALYYATSASEARLSTVEVVSALVVSVFTSLLAGWWPAHVAARTPPAQVLGRGSSLPPAGWILRHPGLGVLLMLAGGVLAALPPLRWEGGVRFPLGGYGAALAWIVGGGVLGGWFLSRAGAWARPLGRQWIAVRLAASQLRRPSGRQVLATAGLTCAVAMTAGMIILVGSFDRTMRGWIARTFQSDLYLSSAGAQSASTDNRLSVETWTAVVRHPAVAEANVLHAGEVRLGGGTTIVVGSDFAFVDRHLPIAWIESPPSGIFSRALEEPPGGSSNGTSIAFVSESFEERFRIGRGDELDLPTPSGARRLRIEGTFADYGNERGSLVIDRRHFTNWFGSPLASSVILQLRDPADAERVRAELLKEHPGLQIFGNRHLRAEVLRIFRQTFAITYALEAIGIAVAVLGLALTLASSLLERRAEQTTLRAIGMAREEMARASALEGLLLATTGLGVGLGVSLLLGWLLIRVINKQTFGWTLQFGLPFAELAVATLLVLVAATTTGYLVGRWGARLPLEREE